jgi:hypothetical protein
MFVMTNDGGPVSDNEVEAAPALCQRAFIFDVMGRSIPIALLHGATFRDSKVFDPPSKLQIPNPGFVQIIAFIFEQGLLLNARRILGNKFWARVEKTHKHLDVQERRTNGVNRISPLRLHRKDCSSRESLWIHLQEDTRGIKYPSLSWCFILHCEALPLIPLRSRTIGGQKLQKDLDGHLRQHLFPRIFPLIDSYLSEWNLDLEIDGKVFTALLGTLLSNATLSLPQQLGDSLSRIATSIKPSAEDPSYLKALRSAFPGKASRSGPRHLAAVPKTLLPFHHDVFDEEFSLINLSSDDLEETIEYGAFEFGRDTAFNDKCHWHNAKRHILPKHLGGEPAKPTDERQRMKMMRKHQRFMSRLTIDAATLTGALGARFNRLTIVTGRTNEAQAKVASHPVCSTLVFLFI